MARVQESFRLIPSGHNVAVVALFSVLAITALAAALFASIGQAWPMSAVAFALSLGLAACAILSLSSSPLDYVEIGPGGLTVQGLFARRSRRWQDIDSFSAWVFPMRGRALVRVTARPNVGSAERPMRLSMSGYMRIGWFTEVADQGRDIASWFDGLSTAYSTGNSRGALPDPPSQFIGKMIELD